MEGDGGVFEIGWFLMKIHFLTKTINFFQKFFFSKYSWQKSTHVTPTNFSLYIAYRKLVFPREFTLHIGNISGPSPSVIYGNKIQKSFFVNCDVRHEIFKKILKMPY